MFARFIDSLLFVFIFLSIIAILLFALDFSLLYIILILSILFSIFLVYLIKHKAKTTKHLSYKEFIIHCILQGNDYVKMLLSEIIYPTKKFKDFDSYIELDNKYIYIYLKFSPLGFDSLVPIYRQAKSLGMKNIIILSAIKDKKILNLTRHLDIDIKIMDLHPIYRKIKTNPILKKKKSKSFNFELKNILLSFFKKQNIKYFVISSISMSILSFFTIYKTYYLYLALVSLLFALINVIVNAFFDNKSYL